MSSYLESQGIHENIQDAKGNWVKNPDFTTLMQLGSSLTGAAAGALAAGSTQGAALGLSVALTAVTNNYLKHSEATRLVVGTGHAQADIVSYANANGLKIIDIGATRPICPSCQNVIGPTGANTATPLKVPPKGSP